MADFDDDDEPGTAVITASRIDLPEERSKAFVIVLAGTSVGQMVRIDDQLVVGRSDRADLKVVDEGASRKHAKIFTRAGVTFVQDLGSTNGTVLNGQKIDGAVPLRDGDKIQIGAACMLKFSLQDDLDEQFQRNLYQAALHDGLTGAHNRKAFNDRLSSEFAYANRHQTALSLMLFDLDHFKRINDVFGHPAGDYVLKTIAEHVGRMVRAEDFFARYGGEEFAVLCRGSSVAESAVLGERLRAMVEAHPFRFDGRDLPVTVSVGIAAFPDPSITDPTALIARADGALYRAKNGGRNRVELA